MNLNGCHARRAVQRTILVGLFLLAPVQSRLGECQGSCVNTAENVTGPVLEQLLDSVSACSVDGVATDSTITDGTFVWTDYNSIWQGAKASLTGRCVVQYMFQGKCFQPRPPSDRNIYFVVLDQELPSGTVSRFQLFNMNGVTQVYKQSIDSSVDGTTNGPFVRGTSLEGTHKFTAHVVSTATTCNI